MARVEWGWGGIISGPHPNNNSNATYNSPASVHALLTSNADAALEGAVPGAWRLFRTMSGSGQQAARHDMHGRGGGAIGGRGGVTRGSMAGSGVL